MAFNKKSGMRILFAAMVAVAVFAGTRFYPKKAVIPADSGRRYSQPPLNQIRPEYRTYFDEAEKLQILSSVDEFMRDFKLPKDSQPVSYALLVEERAGDALKVVTEPGQKQSDFHAILYLRKTGEGWQVDRRAGPWCTLPEFEKGDCLN